MDGFIQDVPVYMVKHSGVVEVGANYKSPVCVCGSLFKWNRYRIKLNSRPQQADISLWGCCRLVAPTSNPLSNPLTTSETKSSGIWSRMESLCPSTPLWTEQEQL